jgi:hypothetical protein
VELLLLPAEALVEQSVKASRATYDFAMRLTNASLSHALLPLRVVAVITALAAF